MAGGHSRGKPAVEIGLGQEQQRKGWLPPVCSCE